MEIFDAKRFIENGILALKNMIVLAEVEYGVLNQ